MYYIGFTGTQHGLTDKQRAALEAHMQRVQETHPQACLHHGDCVGADAEAHEVAEDGCNRLGEHNELERLRSRLPLVDIERPGVSRFLGVRLQGRPFRIRCHDTRPAKSRPVSTRFRGWHGIIETLENTGFPGYSGVWWSPVSNVRVLASYLATSP